MSLTSVSGTGVSAGAAIEYVTVTPGPGLIRLVSVNNDTTAVKASLSIRSGNEPRIKQLFLIPPLNMIDADVPVCWEGEVELGKDQFLEAAFVGNVALDVLTVVVGIDYEKQ